jgi:hypothetical protein
MIGPGSLPRYRPIGLRRPILAYRRKRKRSQPRVKEQTSRTVAGTTELVLFDHGPAEFPVAAVRPREPRARMIALVGDLQHWLVAQWQWFRPRTVPVAVAALSMVAILKSAAYLAHQQVESSPHARVVHIDIAPR